jgi:hypothetical protein
MGPSGDAAFIPSPVNQLIDNGEAVRIGIMRALNRHHVRDPSLGIKRDQTKPFSSSCAGINFARPSERPPEHELLEYQYSKR